MPTASSPRPAVGVDPADGPAVGSARCSARGPRSLAAQSISAHPTPSRAGTRPRTARASRPRGRRRPRTVETRCTRPGCSSTCSSDGTSIEPGSQTRDRSLRTRSTIMTFSSVSLGSSSPAVRAVPLIGADSTMSPSRRRKSSGEAVTTSRPRLGTRTTPAYGAGLPAAEQRGQGQGVGVVREVVLEHPADVDLVDRPERDPAAHVAAGLDVGRPVHRATARRRPARARAARRPASGAGPTAANRAQVRAPSKVATTAQKPVALERGRVVGQVDAARGQPPTEPRERIRVDVGHDGTVAT